MHVSWSPLHYYIPTLNDALVVACSTCQKNLRRQVISVMGMLQPLNKFLKAAFDGYSYGEGCEPKCIGDNYGAYQWLSDKVPRAIYIWFFMPETEQGDGGYIHPLPLQILVSGTGESDHHCKLPVTSPLSIDFIYLSYLFLHINIFLFTQCRQFLLFLEQCAILDGYLPFWVRLQSCNKIAIKIT